MPALPYSARMSTTSGPTDAGSTGNSSVLPSGSLRVAILSAMRSSLLRGAKARHDCTQLGGIVVAAPGHDVPEVVVGHIEQRGEAGGFLVLQRGDESAEKQIELQQPAPAFPLQPLSGSPVHQTARLTSISLMLLIALVGLRPLGQTSTQFMMVWQRNRRYGSSRLSSRSLVAWSRESARKR